MNAIESLRYYGPEIEWDGRPTVYKLPHELDHKDRLLEALKAIFVDPRWDFAPELFEAGRC